MISKSVVYYLNILVQVYNMTLTNFEAFTDSLLDDDVQQNVTTDECRAVVSTTVSLSCGPGRAAGPGRQLTRLASWSRARGRTIQNEWT